MDFCVYKSDPEKAGRLRHRVHVKPSARHVPLSSSSYHPRAIHKAWPVAEMQRMARRSDEWFLLDPAILERCGAWRARIGSRTAQLADSKAKICVPSRVCRLILPYRKELASLPSELLSLWRQWQAHVQGESGRTFDMKVSWSRAGPPLSSLLMW